MHLMDLLTCSGKKMKEEMADFRIPEFSGLIRGNLWFCLLDGFHIAEETLKLSIQVFRIMYFIYLTLFFFAEVKSISWRQVVHNSSKFSVPMLNFFIVYTQVSNYIPMHIRVFRCLCLDSEFPPTPARNRGHHPVDKKKKWWFNRGVSQAQFTIMVSWTKVLNTRHEETFRQAKF